MKFKFHIVKRIVDMESPKNNKKEEFEEILEIGEEFEEYQDTTVFRLGSATSRSAQLEYNRHFTVKNELKAQEFKTDFSLNETKEITSMWGKDQITYKITYIGADEKTLEQAIDENPAEHYEENNADKEEEHRTLDDVVSEQEKSLDHFS